MILNLFSSRPDHPLGDPKELKRAIAELPSDNAFKAIDEVSGWFDSLQHADDFRVDHYFSVVQQLDEAAQVPLRRLARDYLNSPRISKTEERRLWSISYAYYEGLSGLYARCIARAAQNPKDKGSDLLKPMLPLVAARLLATRGTQLKWVEYRYGPASNDLWQAIGHDYLAAEAARYAQKPLQLYPNQPGVTSVLLQYLQALIFHSSSMDSLIPREIELADRLIEHFLSGFVFSEKCTADSVYWVDAASGAPPARLAKNPGKVTPTLRFFSPGTATQALNELIRTVERGDVPENLNLGGQYPAKVVLPVLRHLAMYWAQQPPLREHQRHVVKTRISVLHGFDDSFTVFAGEVARLGKERAAESWVVENVSLGGFGAGVDDLRGDWLKVGTLLSMQPEGGENWVLGAVRRYGKDSDSHASVGIQSLSRQAQSVELRPRASGLAATSAIPGVWLREGNAPGEARLVLPPASFDLRESLEFCHDDRNYLLTPIELEESGADYEIARYREHVAD
jgi:hypothetical protein